MNCQAASQSAGQTSMCNVNVFITAPSVLNYIFIEDATWIRSSSIYNCLQRHVSNWSAMKSLNQSNEVIAVRICKTVYIFFFLHFSSPFLFFLLLLLHLFSCSKRTIFLFRTFFFCAIVRVQWTVGFLFIFNAHTQPKAKRRWFSSFISSVSTSSTLRSNKV